MRIILKNGTLRFYDKSHGCISVAFSIANGSTGRINVGSNSRRQPVLAVSYCDGVLFLDPKSKHGFNKAIRLVYEPDWKDLRAVQHPWFRRSDRFESLCGDRSRCSKREAIARHTVIEGMSYSPAADWRCTKKQLRKLPHNRFFLPNPRSGKGSLADHLFESRF